MKVANKTSIQLRRENITRLLFFLAAVGLVFLVLIIVENLLLSTVLAFVFSYLLSPLVNRLERRGVNRTLSVTLIFALVTLTLAVLLTALFPFISDQMTSFKSEISIYIEGIAHLIKNSEAIFAKLSGTFLILISAKKSSSP
ncbi:MAG: AI-2E family transporter [Bdellovibrionales bacterium]|nr:AI-2E family transporter [Bdellovibrionales bacterium]